MQAMATDQFNAKANPATPVYEGPSGYRRMMSEVRNSLFVEMPELKGRMEIFDWSNPGGKKAEYERIAGSLGTTFEKLEKANRDQSGKGLLEDETLDAGGIAMQYKIDGKTVALSYGSKIFAEGFTKDTVREASRQLVHETFHGIDIVLVRPEIEASAMPADINAYSRAREHFAEIGSTDLLIRNGKRNDIIQSIAGSYQMRQGQTSEDPYRKADIYDNADGFRMLQHLHRNDPDPQSKQDFNLKGWRDSAHRAEQIRQIMPNLSQASVNMDIAQNSALEPARNQFVRRALVDLALDLDMLDKNGVDPRLMVENILTSHTPKNFPYHEIPGEVAGVLPKVFAQQEQWIGWLRDRSFLPMAERIVNGYDIQEGNTQDVLGSMAQPSRSIDQLMGHAAQQWIKTGDRYDQRIFVELAKASDLEISNFMELGIMEPKAPASREGFAENSTRESLAAQSDKLARLAKGENFDDVYQTGGVQTDDYLKKEYFRSKVAPETPFPQK